MDASRAGRFGEGREKREGAPLFFRNVFLTREFNILSKRIRSGVQQ